MLTKLVISLCLPMSVWTVFVCLPACLKNTHPNFAKLLFCSCNKMWPWLSPHLTTVQYGYVLPVLWMTSCSQVMARYRRRNNNACAQSDALWGSTRAKFDADDCPVTIHSALDLHTKSIRAGFTRLIYLCHATISINALKSLQYFRRIFLISALPSML